MAMQWRGGQLLGVAAAPLLSLASWLQRLPSSITSQSAMLPGVPCAYCALTLPRRLR